MKVYPEIALYYFDVRGRAQFIRGLFTAREIPFADQRVQMSADLSSWQETRKDRSVSGSFQKVPNLKWGDVMVGEVLVIMDFLYKKLGDAELLSEEQSLQHAMLTSSAFLDLVTPVINLVWCDIFFPGADVAKTTASIRVRIERLFITLNESLGEWQWNEKMNSRPVMGADAVLWEALDMVRIAFDEKVTLDNLPVLDQFYQECPGREAFQQQLASHPAPLTARPGEPEMLEKIYKTLE